MNSGLSSRISIFNLEGKINVTFAFFTKFNSSKSALVFFKSIQNKLMQFLNLICLIISSLCIDSLPFTFTSDKEKPRFERR